MDHLESGSVGAVKWFLRSFSSPESSQGEAPEFSNLTAWERDLFCIVQPVIVREREAVLRRFKCDAIAATAAQLYFRVAPRSAIAALAAAFEADIRQTVPALDAGAPAYLGQITANTGTKLEFVRRFPLLVRLLAPQLRNWFAAGAEFARRLSADTPYLLQFLGTDEIHLEGVHPFKGDPHNGQRCATAVTFREGAVMYKPGPIGVLGPIKALLDGLCRAARCEPLKLPRALDRAEYGWIEWIPRAPCETDKDVQHYYRRLGELHALAWICGAEDLHSDNVLACGVEPVMVDLETLMSPLVSQVQAARTQVHEFPISESGLTTGVLPMPMEIEAGRWVDHSAFGDRGAGELPPSRPTRADGRQVEPFHFAQHFLGGADGVLGLVADDALAIAAELDAIRFGDATIRVVIRDTVRYAAVQARLLDSGCLRDPLAADAVFDSLASAPVAELSECDRAILQFERDQILDGDIPCFRASITDGALICGESALPDFFEQSALERVRRRLWTLSRSRAAVMWSNRAAVHVAAANTGVAAGPGDQGMTSVPIAPPPHDEAVRLLAERVCQLMFGRDAQRGWLTVRRTSGIRGSWELVPADASLWHGTAGILLFLASAQEVAATSSRVLETVACLKASTADAFFARPAGVNHLDAGLVLMELGCDARAILERAAEIAPEWDHDPEVVIGLARILRHPRAFDCRAAPEMARRTIGLLEGFYTTSGFDSKLEFLAGWRMRSHLEAVRLRRIYVGDEASICLSPRVAVPVDLDAAGVAEDLLHIMDRILLGLARAEIYGACGELGDRAVGLRRDLIRADRLARCDSFIGACGVLELWALAMPHVGRETCNDHIAGIGARLASRIVESKGVIRNSLDIDSPQLLIGSAGVGYQLLRHFGARDLPSLLF